MLDDKMNETEVLRLVRRNKEPFTIIMKFPVDHTEVNYKKFISTDAAIESVETMPGIEPKVIYTK